MTSDSNAPVVLSISITERGQKQAQQLPFTHHHGELAETVREQWANADALVLFCAVGIAVRVIGPLLESKATDPAVICVDEAGTFVVALVGGHKRADAGLDEGIRSANDLAALVSDLLGATAVVTTATDSSGTIALDTLPGFSTSGDIAGVSRQILDGASPTLLNETSWPIPSELQRVTTTADPVTTTADPVTTTADATEAAAIVISDQVRVSQAGQVVLRPPSLVVGIGASTNAPAEAAADVLREVLEQHSLASESIGTIATIDRRANDVVVTSLDLPVRSFTAAELNTVEVPNPSEVVQSEVGTDSVCEAAALLAAGPGAELIVQKTKGLTATIAIARRKQPEGEVIVVGLGPGHAKHRTPQAEAAIRHADVVIGYAFYVDQCAHLTSANQEVVRSPIGAEVDRCREAVERASHGQRVALVCSGDPGIFAMATLVLEVAPEYGHPPVTVVPGVTASLGASAILGAPLAHDHALVSLSDLLTPWELIERRLHALAEADMAVAFYNPRSQRRITQLQAAKDILLAKRPATTPVGIVVNATRPEERVILTTLSDLDPAEVDMFSIVVVGSSTSYFSNGRIVTPRGYDA